MLPELPAWATRAWRILPVLLALPASAATHDSGRLSLSLGGSAAYSQNQETRSSGASQVLVDNETVQLPPLEQRDRYTDVDLSVFLSGGYFFVPRLETGLTSSSLITRYSSTDRGNFSLYDGQLYAKYFFDNPTVLTPYVKMQGGLSWLTSGTYHEANQVAGLVGGLEYYGLGPLAWFAELSTQYTDLGGDRQGYEWRNQLYLGVSLYLDMKQTPAPAAATTGVADPVANLPPAVQRWIHDADKQWGDDLQRVDQKVGKPADAAKP